MACRRCGAPLMPAAAYCGNCGWINAALVCPRCRTENEPGSRFCRQCGMSLDRAARQMPEAPEERVADSAAGLRSVGFLVRLVAWIIDGLIVGVVQIVPLAVLFGDTSVAEQLAENVGSLIALTILSVPALYHTIGVTYWGATVGKAAFGLRVIGPDGRNPGIFRAFFRWLTLWASLAIFAPIVLVIVFEGRKRGLHDMICETRVVRR